MPLPPSFLGVNPLPARFSPNWFPPLHRVFGVVLSNAAPSGAESDPAPSSPKTDLTDSPLYSLAGDLARHPLCMGLMSVSALVAIAGSRQLGAGLNQLGTWGEELFRGDRLPLLHNAAVDSAADSAAHDLDKEPS
ncbi:MAG: hypothetical protein ACFCBU_05045 [Cyanophyceae cyanobacterium]